jgi:hypothetical protein
MPVVCWKRLISVLLKEKKVSELFNFLSAYRSPRHFTQSSCTFLCTTSRHGSWFGHGGRGERREGEEMGALGGRRDGVSSVGREVHAWLECEACLHSLTHIYSPRETLELPGYSISDCLLHSHMDGGPFYTLLRMLFVLLSGVCNQTVSSLSYQVVSS